MQVKGVEPPGMGAVGGVCEFELSDEERAYYISAVKTARKIVVVAMAGDGMDVGVIRHEFVTEMSKAVFDKLASPLFYLQSEKREEVKSERPGQA